MERIEKKGVSPKENTMLAITIYLLEALHDSPAGATLPVPVVPRLAT